mmetsp:Transcript_73912/g.208354  ORF Transcript_73912/g.208354 Transcript_73912/m.208354 type:complete len:266 (-) Transcript_73912:1743-2540(-)
MLNDLLDAPRPHGQTLAGLLLAELAHQRSPRLLGLLGEWKLDALQDGIEDVGDRLTLKRCVAGHKLEDHNPQSPPVHGPGVAHLLRQFWCEVLRRATSRVRVTNCDLRESKVRNLAIAIGIQEHILRLQVPVDDVEGVQVLEGPHDASDVEASRPLRSLGVADLVAEHMYRGLHQEVQVVPSIERGSQADHERVVGEPHDPLLVHHALLGVLLQDVPFGQGLESQPLPSEVAFHQRHDAKSASTEDPLCREFREVVLKANLFLDL